MALVDFGLSSFISRGEDSTDASFMGTPLYMAPSIFQEHQKYRIVSSDLWSVGMTTAEAVSGQHPFSHVEGHEELLVELERGFDFSSLKTRTLRRILNGLLQVDENNRLDLKGALMLLLADKGKPTNQGIPLSGLASFSGVSVAH